MKALYCYRQQEWCIYLDYIGRFLHCPEGISGCFVCPHSGFKDIPPEEDDGTWQPEREGEEHRCITCAVFNLCPAANTGVLYPCPEYTPIETEEGTS